MRFYRTLMVFAVTGTLAVAVPAASLEAQEEGTVAFEARAGLAFPAGDLADVADVGGTFGAAASYRFHRYFGWRAGIEAIFLNDTRDQFGVVPSPAMDMIHFTTGPEVVFPPPSMQDMPMTFRLFAGLGGATIDAQETFSDASSVDFDHSYLALSFGGAAGYQVTPTVEVFADGRALLLFFDEADTGVFSDRSQFVDAFSRGWVVPVTAGIRLAFQP